MSATPTLRALEPADAAPLHAVFTHPEVAAELPEHDPSQPVGLFRTLLESVDPSSSMWVGAWLEGALVGATSLTAIARPRRKHAGSVRVGVLPHPRAAEIEQVLLAAALDAGSRWYHLDRIELSIPAPAEAKLRLAADLAFLTEARRRQALVRGGERVDLMTLAWIRPGVVSVTGEPELPARSGSKLEVQVRTVRPDDGLAIAERQGTESVRWGTMQLPFTPGAFWTRRVATNDPAQHHLRVAEVAGRVVGMAGLHGEGLLRTQHAWPFGISVHPDVQGRGVGSALMRDVMHLADHGLGVGRVELEVYADNERAIRMYRAHGFEAEGTKRCDTWRGAGYVDTLIMGRLR